MNYEQKYKEALKRAKKFKETCDSAGIISWCEYIFPELKESEGEKIRKQIISFLKEFECDHYRSLDFSSWIAWLEKQGEQKPADKVESKFKVGDWIIQENIGVYKVIEICKSWYEVINTEDKHYSISFDKEYMCHLWSIEDAKDGDVLATKDNYICIFDNTVEEGKYPFAYCGLSTHFEFEIYDRTLPFTHDSVYPATKEQRDLLFQKMKEAGYKWDADKKELLKL